MKYTAQSGKYILKNFWHIFPFAIIPAFFFALSADRESIRCAIETLLTGDISSFHFSHLFRAISILNFASWQSVVFGLLGVVLIIVCVAMMLALLDKHMRIGKRTYNGLFSKLNDNLVSTAGYAFLLLVLYEVWSLVTAALLHFFSMISNAVIAYLLAGVSFLGMHAVLIYVIGTVYLWLPCMQITGFKAMEALQYSYQLIAPVKWRILLGQLGSLLFVEALIAACAFFAPDGVVFYAASTAIYTALIMIYCVRMMIAYFDRDNIQRADLNRYY
ncbi:MAG: hypothetical protein IJX91_00150 [Clostridia bacterium]|nr:hypothetical protein [Clostridia bacterium]